MNEKKYSPKRLQHYALWYYFKYFPSNTRLKQRLYKKATCEDVAQVFSNIEHLLNEKLIIETKIAGFLRKGRNFHYIRKNLRQKLFKSELIEECLKTHEGRSLINQDKMLDLIKKMQRKGKSLKMIKQKLCENQFDSELFERITEKYSLSDHNSIEFMLSKGQKKYELQKLLHKLLHEGFHYEDIQQCLQ